VTKPRTPRRKLAFKWILLIAFLVSLPISGCSVGGFPGMMNLVAPVICPAGTKDSVVVARWGGNAKGGKSLKSQLWCIDAEGGGRHASDFKAFLVFALAWSTLFLGVYGALRLARREQRR
jgi:hypothetical protein